jgi:YVTN family beta-propeller protein
VKRVSFPTGSKPFMLRVSPNGKVVWVQTQTTAQNVVLDVETMDVLNSVPAGLDPEQSAFQPNAGRYGLIAHVASTALVVLDAASGNRVTSVELDGSQGNISFTPDGSLAFVSNTSRNQVIIVDMQRLSVTARIPTGAAPQGLVLLDPHAP